MPAGWQIVALPAHLGKPASRTPRARPAAAAGRLPAMHAFPRRMHAPSMIRQVVSASNRMIIPITINSPSNKNFFVLLFSVLAPCCWSSAQTSGALVHNFLKLRQGTSTCTAAHCVAVYTHSACMVIAWERAWMAGWAARRVSTPSACSAMPMKPRVVLCWPR